MFQMEELQVDFDIKKLYVQGKQVKLTAREFQLLECLIQNKGRVLTKETLLQKIWDMEGTYVEENTLFVTITRLRKKIEPDPSEPAYIKTVYGTGYVFGDL